MLRPVLTGLLSAASGTSDRRRLLILTYHRTLACSDPLINDITGSTFDAQLQTLARYCNVLRLDEAMARLDARQLPPRAVVITFDDGYRDNFDIALPALRTHGLKATFFIATAFLDDGVMWNDRIIEAVRAAGTQDVADACRQLVGNEPAASDLETRRILIRNRIQSLKYQDPEAREAGARELAERLHVTEIPSPMMTRRNVRSLSDHGMEIGAHTRTHPILARTTPEQAECEIADGRDELESVTGRPVRSFAYPNGKPGTDFDDMHVDLLRKLRFTAAVTTAHGVADYSSDRLLLPRVGLWQARPMKILAGLLRNFLSK